MNPFACESCGGGTNRVDTGRIMNKLDEYFNRNDYVAAERHLLYWLSESLAARDARAELPIRNELMGLYRKLGRREDAIAAAEAALATVEQMPRCDAVGAATTYLNSATVYKAFSMADRALPLFERAKAIYEKELNGNDTRLAGLYNNMALALVDLKRFDEADHLYRNAILILEKSESGAPEIAITYLNMASAVEAKLGLEDAAEVIGEYLRMAEELLEGEEKRDGYYAFVCEKCASVFDYYGYFYYAKQLKERAKGIYEGT